MTCDLNRDKLDAYADESLSPEELAAIEDHMRNCPSCAAEALARLQMKRATRTAAANFALSAGFTMRPEFRRKLEKTIQKSQRPLWGNARLQWLAAAAVALLLLAASVITVTRHASREQALAELLDLHVATMASANPVDVVSTDRHTVKPWFQGRLNFSPDVPNLASDGFPLVGGRLDTIGGHPVAALVYMRGKHTINVFVMPAVSGSQVSSASQSGYHLIHWSEHGLEYWAVSDTDSLPQFRDRFLTETQP